jgi:hypothetical protein
LKRTESKAETSKPDSKEMGKQRKFIVVDRLGHMCYAMSRK